MNFGSNGEGPHSTEQLLAGRGHEVHSEQAMLRWIDSVGLIDALERLLGFQAKPNNHTFGAFLTV